MIDLTPEGLVVRPFWSSLNRKVVRIGEEVLSAHVRPRDRRTDLNVRATGVYAAGGPLEFAGFEVVTCRTAQGVIEFAIPRPDVPLFLHYVNRRRN
jgi:hypothetical protein